MFERKKKLLLIKYIRTIGPETEKNIIMQSFYTTNTKYGVFSFFYFYITQFDFPLNNRIYNIGCNLSKAYYCNVCCCSKHYIIIVLRKRNVQIIKILNYIIILIHSGVSQLVHNNNTYAPCDKSFLFRVCSDNFTSEKPNVPILSLYYIIMPQGNLSPALVSKCFIPYGRPYT